MRYYPVNLDVRNRACLVVGGGKVGARKVKTLMDCGARVTVVSPAMDPSLAALAGQPALTLKNRPYRSTDLDDMFLVIGATDDENLNQQISRDAEDRNLLCNIADRPRVCNFILPAIVSRGDLVITVSTSGQSPAFAKQLKTALANEFGEEYAVLLKLMGAIRKKLLCVAHAPEAHKPLFEQLLAGDPADLIRKGDYQAIDDLLFNVLGPGYRFEELMRPGDRC